MLVKSPCEGGSRINQQQSVLVHKYHDSDRVDGRCLVVSTAILSKAKVPVKHGPGMVVHYSLRLIPV